MAIREILLLGNPRLYEKSAPVLEEEMEAIQSVVTDLHDTLMNFRRRYGVGRAIAAPQIGVMKRLLYLFVDDVSTVFINPRLEDKSKDMMDVWDDCLCFPDLLVKVMRHTSCRIRYRNLQWEEESMFLHGDLSELLQHEYDHLDGILAVSRAVDGRSFALKSEKGFLEKCRVQPHSSI
ncbi:MAG TPA: peptide deformylase [Syntrophales bacterium]|nr:peptide deformylase [Syntrophales bacterium]